MCTQRISKCSSCGFARHIFWAQCLANLRAQSVAVARLETAPLPAMCEDLTQAEIAMWIKPRACPTDNDACGGIRRKEAEEQLERERKDSGVSGVAEDDSSLNDIRSEGGDSNWEDVAVEEDSVAVEEESVAVEEEARPATAIKFAKAPYDRGDRRKPKGPNVKYAPGFVEVGPRSVGPNARNMGMSYALHAGSATRPAEVKGTDNVGSVRHRYAFNQDTSVVVPWDIRENTEPDETYLLIMGYNNIPEVRQQWAAKKKEGQERPVKTLADVVEEIFGESQNLKT